MRSILTFPVLGAWLLVLIPFIGAGVVTVAELWGAVVLTVAALAVIWLPWRRKRESPPV
jgi:hypothetical protein